MSATADPGDTPAAQAPLQVLYVEDNRVNALLFEQMLQAEPRIALRLAEDGAEAMALVEAWQPQVLVIDSHLPDTTGCDLLAALRARPALQQVPAFMCTADSLPEAWQQAKTAGFAGFWTKPVHPPEVLAALLALHNVRR